jgi:hypothetical protein
VRDIEAQSVQRLKQRLAELCVLLPTYARLAALKVIDEAVYRRKLTLARDVLSIFHAAVTVQQWVRQQFHCSASPVGWPDEFNPSRLGVLSDGRIDPTALSYSLSCVCSAILAARSAALECCSFREFSHWVPTIEELFSKIPMEGVDKPANGPRSFQVAERAALSRVPTKAVVGPRLSRLDPIFACQYSLREFSAPIRADRLEAMVPYFWTLSSREAMVCDSCLLSIVEYDGMPLRFYVDMARQAADESRHAVMYLDLAIELMPAYLESPARDPKTAAFIESFLNHRGGLPTPREGNLFSCMWHASLEERLVIMQIATEGAAVSSTRRAIRSSLARQFPSVMRAFEVDYYDEVAHTRIGTTWLRHLCPDAEERKNAIESTKLLRGILLLTCFASDDETVSDAASRMRRTSLPNYLN